MKRLLALFILSFCWASDASAKKVRSVTLHETCVSNLADAAAQTAMLGFGDEIDLNSLQPDQEYSFRFAGESVSQTLIFSKAALRFIQRNGYKERWIYAFLRGLVPGVGYQGLKRVLNQPFSHEIKLISRGHIRIAVQNHGSQWILLHGFKWD